MNAKYWQRGETLDYTPTEKVENGAVVSLGTRVGVAGSTIEAGELGHLHVVGVFEMDKADGVAVSMGNSVYYNTTNDNITTTASGNVPAGYAAAAAAAADTVVLVKLLG